MLSLIDQKVLQSVISKQAALSLLKTQASFIKNMIHEGLMTEKDGELFFEEISKDEIRIKNERLKDLKYVILKLFLFNFQRITYFLGVSEKPPEANGFTNCPIFLKEIQFLVIHRSKTKLGMCYKQIIKCDFIYLHHLLHIESEND